MEFAVSESNVNATTGEKLFKEGFLLMSEEAKLDLLMRLAITVRKDTVPSISSATSQKNESSSSDSSTASRKKVILKPKKETYSKELKVEAVEMAVQLNNNTDTATKIREKYKSQSLYQNLCEKSIREWRKDPNLNKHLDKDQGTHQRRQYRKLASPYHDKEVVLVEVIKRKREKAEKVTRYWMKAEALRTFDDPRFVASTGWFAKFRKRWRITQRVATPIIQKLSDSYTTELQKYLERLRRLRFDVEVTKRRKLISANMDETCMQFDMSNGTTYDFIGRKEINVKSSNGRRATFTLMLTVFDDGSKMPPLFIFKSRYHIPQALKQKYGKRALLYSNTNGWNTEAIMFEWCNNFWSNLRKDENQDLLLVMDKFSVHCKDSITSTIKKTSYIEIIPPGCTGLAQPLDTHINKSLKTRIRARFEAWFERHGQTASNATKSGVLRAPPIDDVIQWALEAWEEIPREMIIRSFKHCGISLAPDGSDLTLLNPKLKSIREVKEYLHKEFVQPSFHPCSDRDEVLNEIKKDENGISYQTEQPNLDVESPVSTDMVEEETPDALDTLEAVPSSLEG